MMNKTALITGASRGIGRGIAEALAERYWAIVLNYQGNETAARETLRIITDRGGKGFLVQADISSAVERQRLVAETLDKFGRIDLLVNNAGVAPRERLDILKVGEVSYDEVLNTNLKKYSTLLHFILNPPDLNPKNSPSRLSIVRISEILM